MGLLLAVFGGAPLRRRLPQEGRYEADVIDTWEMTVETVGIFEGQVAIELPGRPDLMLRIRPVK